MAQSAMSMPLIAPPPTTPVMPWPIIATCSFCQSRSIWAGSSPTSTDLRRSEEHTSELQSLMRISYAVFCLKKKKKTNYMTKINEYKDKKQKSRITDNIQKRNKLSNNKGILI